jgi:putative transposase
MQRVTLCRLVCGYVIATTAFNVNAAQNIRVEGIRMIKAEGSAVSAVGGEVSPTLGRKSKFRHSPVITEAPTSTVLGKLG